MPLRFRNKKLNKILEDETVGVLGLTQDEHLVQDLRSSCKKKLHYFKLMLMRFNSHTW